MKIENKYLEIWFQPKFLGLWKISRKEHVAEKGWEFKERW